MMRGALLLIVACTVSCAVLGLRVPCDGDEACPDDGRCGPDGFCVVAEGEGEGEGEAQCPGDDETFDRCGEVAIPCEHFAALVVSADDSETEECAADLESALARTGAGDTIFIGAGSHARPADPWVGGGQRIVGRNNSTALIGDTPLFLLTDAGLSLERLLLNVSGSGPALSGLREPDGDAPVLSLVLVSFSGGPTAIDVTNFVVDASDVGFGPPASTDTPSVRIHSENDGHRSSFFRACTFDQAGLDVTGVNAVHLDGSSFTVTATQSLSFAASQTFMFGGSVHAGGVPAACPADGAALEVHGGRATFAGVMFDDMPCAALSIDDDLLALAGVDLGDTPDETGFAHGGNTFTSAPAIHVYDIAPAEFVIDATGNTFADGVPVCGQDIVVDDESAIVKYGPQGTDRCPQ